MKETLNYIKQTLMEHYPSGEIDALTTWIMEKVCHLQPYQWKIFQDYTFSIEEKTKIHTIVSRLQQFEPIQYIIGETTFCDLPFTVNRSVLIPRPETEELVKLITQKYSNQAIRILDIGTGSGCIAISLAHQLPQAKVYALDLSPEALETARMNALRNQVDISFLQADILQETDTPNLLPDQLDVIVSNPPYIMEKERHTMERNVLDYEPAMALFVPDHDPLCFYQAIAKIGKSRLKPNGQLYFEINATCGNATCQLLQKEGYSDVTCYKDLSNKDRIIKATYERN